MHEGAAAPSYLIRRTGFAGSRSGPSGRFLYHFPAVTEGDRKMMQLEKMKISFFRRVLTLSTPFEKMKFFIFSSCIIFLCRPSKGFALRRVRSANFQFAVASRANALPPLSPSVTAGRRPRLRGWRSEDSALALRRAGTPGK